MQSSGTSLESVRSPFDTLGAFIHPEQVISVVFFVLFVIWVLYTIIAAYHLLRYGHRSAVTVPALITHVLVSGYLALFAVSGLH